MTGLAEKLQRARGRAGALAAGVATLTDYLRPGYATTHPYLCTGHGHYITRLHRPQKTAIEGKRNAPCTRRDCPGLLFATTWDHEGRRFREVLRQAADAITCRGDGLELIHTRTNGAPLHGGAATNNDDELGSATS